MKDFPISEKRKEYVISKILSTFDYTALSRRAVNLRYVSSGEDFVRLGLNLIVDKIWFVDYVGETTYGYETMGFMEGKSVALSETKLVIERISQETDIKENKINVSELTENVLLDAIKRFTRTGSVCDIITTNVRDGLKFWWFKSFEGVYSRANSPFGFEGHFHSIPVYWSNLLPEKTTMLINKSVGELLIKQDISASLSEIKEDEVEGVLNSIPNLDKEKLKEKVRLKVEEVIRFDIKHKDAITIISTKDSAE